MLLVDLIPYHIYDSPEKDTLNICKYPLTTKEHS